MSIEFPKGVRYRVYKTRNYTIYYIVGEVEIKNINRKMIKGGHEFLYVENTIVIRPVKQISPTQEVAAS
ncbi:MAG: hypothetical protein ACK4M3_04040 [Pyrobaculum sp.]